MDEKPAVLELFQRLHDTLRRCDAFDKDEALLATFESDPRLHPWQDLVPDALNRAERVRLTVALLQDRFNDAGHPALVLLLDVLRDQTDPADQLYQELKMLAGALSEALGRAEFQPVEPDKPEPPAPGQSPFKGLFYYDVDDAENFFGREALTSTLLRLLPRPGTSREEGEAQFMAIVGPSGSGKTSLLRAGLLAVLQDAENGAGEPPEAAQWPTFLVTPTAQPLQKLAASLTREDDSVRVAAQLVDDMRAEPRSLSLFAHRLLETQQAACLLLVVDQLEELFTLCADEGVRQAYLDNLLTACTTGPVLLVTALRSDYYDAAGHYETLRTLLGQRQVYIGRMSEEELRRAIQEPVLQNGWRFETGLVDRILVDVGNDPGTLPLLSQALHATWEHREGHTLTHNGYQQAGGVAGAIARSAEAMFESLTLEEREAARVMLLRMVAPAGGSDSTRLPADARVPVSRGELVIGDGTGPARSALNALVGAHLIVEEGDMVALAHEALIRQWARLRRWLNEERQRLTLHRRLTMAAQLWQELGQNPHATYRGDPLQEAEAYAADPAIPLTTLETAFLQASRFEVARQQAEQEHRVRAAKWAPAGGALGGALGYGFSVWLMYDPLFVVGRYLPFVHILYTVALSVLGGVVGAVLVWRLGLGEAAAPGDARQPRALREGAVRGALVFAVFLLAHVLIVEEENFRSPMTILLAVLQGALWGLVSGAGLLWVRASHRPQWQTLVVTVLASGLVLMLLNPVTDTFALQANRASNVTVFVTGALTPLAILLGAQLAVARLLPVPEKRERPATIAG